MKRCPTDVSKGEVVAMAEALPLSGNELSGLLLIRNLPELRELTFRAAFRYRDAEPHATARRLQLRRTV